MRSNDPSIRAETAWKAGETGFGAGEIAPAASRVTGHLPRDQALGLRLIAQARAASAMHLAQAALAGSRRSCAPELAQSQAGRLIELMRQSGRKDGPR